MKKIGKILLMIGGIYSIVTMVLVLALGIFLTVLSSPSWTQTIIDYINEGNISAIGEYTAEESTQIYQMVFLVLGVIYLIEVGFDIANCVLSFRGQAKQTKALMIVNIVFGFLTGVLFNAAGGIVSLIALSKENNSNSHSRDQKQSNAEVVDEQSGQEELDNDSDITFEE